jgi:hypothetical protein
MRKALFITLVMVLALVMAQGGVLAQPAGSAGQGGGWVLPVDGRTWTWRVAGPGRLVLSLDAGHADGAAGSSARETPIKGSG